MGPDMTPALIIISVALRLAHKIGLHNRLASDHLDSVERRQRARLFWLAYILDKDSSLRTQQPSVQVDDDIDIDLPVWLPSEDDNDAGIGTVTTSDGSAKMDHFLARVQLAHIQGSIADHLYSTRSSKRSVEERKAIRERIVTALDEWKASVPSEFSAANVMMTTSNNPSTAGFFCALHTCSLLCLVLITRSHAWDEQWVSDLRDHGRGNRVLELPSDFAAMVGQARDLMILFEHTIKAYAWLKWVGACTYTSAMVLLTANKLHNIHHEEFEKDTDRIERSLAWFREASKQRPSKVADMLCDVCAEAVETMKQRRADDLTLTLDGDWLVGFINSLEPSDRI
ncbi:hypothetical protein BFJ68_g16921 [Fusarium oxysporum]|uniref:Xylanolytic transcriptional activator regulatory domain-containing protein n=2 Tax=Fusarium oxysporum TaxID=5507 RepID=A0A420M9M3_FUSOX|nr:hypothetical protein BFJ69_g16978 [Fusarium oxysporum]RKK88593.1 hypothetical protein BFJ68_g16921 [Fusarium oxysporum]